MFSPDDIDRMSPAIREELQLWLLSRYFARKRANDHSPSTRGMVAEPVRKPKMWPLAWGDDKSLRLLMERR